MTKPKRQVEFKEMALRLRGIDAEACALVLRGLAKRGRLTPETVVREARKPESPLHDAFTWDDSVAADLHRLNEARYLIRAVVTVIPHKNRTIRVWASVTREEDGTDGREYVEVATAMKNPSLRRQILSNAMRDAETYREKYADLEEVAKIIRAIDATLKALSA